MSETTIRLESGMSKDDARALYEAWREMDLAALQMLAARPATMGAAADQLTKARELLREMVWKVTV